MTWWIYFVLSTDRLLASLLMVNSGLSDVDFAVYGEVFLVVYWCNRTF